MTTETQIPAGKILMLSSGEYSDYSVMGVFRTLKPITQDVYSAMRDACFSASPGYDRYEVGKAAPWLIVNGYVEEVEHEELYLGDYGRIPETLHR
jgi:hypothetical protein